MVGTKAQVVRLPKAVKRITILRVEQSGDVSRTVLKGKKKTKKLSKGLRLFERLARRSARANATLSSEYVDRHRRSNRKRRDGWLRDFGKNIAGAQRKSNKRLRFGRLFSP